MGSPASRFSETWIVSGRRLVDKVESRLYSFFGCHVIALRSSVCWGTTCTEKVGISADLKGNWNWIILWPLYTCTGCVILCRIPTSVPKKHSWNGHITKASLLAGVWFALAMHWGQTGYIQPPRFCLRVDNRTCNILGWGGVLTSLVVRTCKNFQLRYWFL